MICKRTKIRGENGSKQIYFLQIKISFLALYFTCFGFILNLLIRLPHFFRFLLRKKALFIHDFKNNVYAYYRMDNIPMTSQRVKWRFL